MTVRRRTRRQALFDAKVLQAGSRRPAYCSAGDFCAGIAGRPGRKVIGMVVDDNGSSDDLVYGKPIGEKQGERKSVVSEQRRQVPGVVRMFTVPRVVMGHGVGKGIVHITRAVGPLVDMKPEDALPAGSFGMGQAVDFSQDDDAFADLVEPHRARYIRVSFTACNFCRRLRTAAQNGKKMDF